MNIDYTKLNKRIVEQAHEASRTFFALNEDQKAELFRNRIDRARVMLRAREQFDRLVKEN